MFNIGGLELLIIMLVALVFLGPQKLPQVARQVGQAVSTLRSMANGFQAELEAASKAVTTSDSAMTMSGPTPTDEAIARTQTDPRSIADKARNRSVSEQNPRTKSTGGPTDLRDETAAETSDDLRDASRDPAQPEHTATVESGTVESGTAESGTAFEPSDAETGETDA